MSVHMPRAPPVPRSRTTSLVGRLAGRRATPTQQVLLELRPACKCARQKDRPKCVTSVHRDQTRPPPHQSSEAPAQWPQLSAGVRSMLSSTVVSERANTDAAARWQSGRASGSSRLSLWSRRERKAGEAQTYWTDPRVRPGSHHGGAAGGTGPRERRQHRRQKTSQGQ